MTADATIIHGDCIKVMRGMDAGSFHACVTSPPYHGQRDYQVDGQIGMEATFDEHLENLVAVFREVKRVLRDDATLWLNYGDKRNKACTEWLGMPHRVREALQGDGWLWADEIIWHKPNPMPESTEKRTTRCHEYLFLLVKKPKYYYDAEAIKEPAQDWGDRDRTNWKARDTRHNTSKPHTGGERCDFRESGRNKRSFWTISTESFAAAHFATFPRRLVEPCVMAGTSDKGCCPECGAPWARVVEKDRRPTRPGSNTKITRPRGWADSGKHTSIEWMRDSSEIGNRDPQRHETTSRTVGWKRGCKCFYSVVSPELGGTDAPDPIPCTVLDPFAGSGTVGVVCRQLGRSFVGIELSLEYCEMARKRIANPERLPPLVDVPDQMTIGFAE